MNTELRIMTVHAHPDDEASKGAGTIAKYSAAGARCVLVCCTGGEAGDIINPAMDRPEILENIAAVRMGELEEAADIIGYHRVAMLGYLDSGMPDMPENAHPDNFANAPLEEAIGRLVKLIREERPHVIVTYSDHQTGYMHPDHLMVNDVTLPAFDAAADPAFHPELGDPWQPLKLYYTMWSKERLELTHQACLEHLGESPFDQKWLKDREGEDHLITSKVDVAEYWDQRCDALLAHATQVDPNEKFWFPLPREIAAHVYPWDDYELAKTAGGVEVNLGEGEFEDDLFDGIRAEVTT
ncbi:MAG: mycothiol conjugate amidase Mca [Acidimicrobiales bacterium]|nr:mycothiol conjugate amidase Mca [Acidimicrobiales bacterium]RZV47790.1 MAG: mycothiol conjugate amidase Mca [Acidimicrobiales bacterium]